MNAAAFNTHLHHFILQVAPIADFYQCDPLRLYMEEKLRTEAPPVGLCTLQIVSSFESAFPHQVHDWTPREGKADRNIYVEIAKECTIVSGGGAQAKIPDAERGWVRSLHCKVGLATASASASASASPGPGVCGYVMTTKPKRTLRSNAPVVDALERLSTKTLVRVMAEISLLP